MILKLSTPIALLVLTTGGGLGTALADSLNNTPTVAHASEANALSVPPPGVAAVVNGKPIKYSEVNEMAGQIYGSQVIESLIRERLIDDEARRQHIVVADSDIEARISRLTIAVKPQTLAQAMQQHHETMAMLKARLRRQAELDAIVSPSIHLNKMVHVHHILIQVKGSAPIAGQGMGHTDAEALSLISTIQDKLKAGASFDDLAKQYSEDDFTKDQGGDLGIIHENLSFRQNLPIDPAFIAAAVALNKGDITKDPVKSVIGYHLIECVSTDKDHPKDEDDKYLKEAQDYRQTELHLAEDTYLSDLENKSAVVNYITNEVKGPGLPAKPVQK